MDLDTRKIAFVQEFLKLQSDDGSISKVGSKLKINFLCALNYLDE